MKENKVETVIESENVTHFEFVEEEFYIEYNPSLNVWKAVSYNEEEFEEAIILEENSIVQYDLESKNIDLFGNEIEISLLQSYKEYIK